MHQYIINTQVKCVIYSHIVIVIFSTKRTVLLVSVNVSVIVVKVNTYEGADYTYFYAS